MRHPLAALAALSCMAACAGASHSDDSDLPEPIDAGSANYSASLGREPDFSDPHSRLRAEVWPTEGAWLSGAFHDGPPLRLHTEAERRGSCRLMTYTPSTCDPRCDEGELCVHGSCVAYPTRQDRGALEWAWPEGSLRVEPDSLLGYYATAPQAREGELSLTFEGITLTAPTQPLPEQDGDWMSQLNQRARGADVTLRWTNPVRDARVRVHMTDCVGSHGGFAAAEIECEGPDSGELVLPGAYLDALDDGSWSRGECGSHVFDRMHIAAPPQDTKTRFEVVSNGRFFYRPM